MATTEELTPSERRLRLLLDVGERLRDLSDPPEVMAVAAEILGRYLGAGCAGYAENDATGEFFEIERDWTDGTMPSCAGRYSLDDFGHPLVRELRAGATIRLDDTLVNQRFVGEDI